MEVAKPSLCFVGHMLGRNPGFVTTQGQIAADLFVQNGYRTRSVSSQMNRIVRLIDMTQTVIRRRSGTDVFVVEVYSGLSFVMADVVSLAGRLVGVPMIGVLHGGNLPDFTKRFPRWTLRVLRRFGQLVAPSAFLAHAIQRAGIDSPRVIPNIIDLEAYPHKLRRDLRPKLLWMRAFHSIYNPEMALRAFAAVQSEYPNATLVMAGADKGLEDSIKKMTVEMGMGRSVRFPGFLDREAKLNEFSAADIYLHTNRIDNMPVSVVEACAMGLPVVATNVGGIPYLLSDGENALIVESDNDLQMSNAIKDLLNDPELTAKLSKKGRILAEASAWTAVQPMWDEVFRDVLRPTAQYDLVGCAIDKN